ncbi:MAG: homoserine kinase [Candidatus Nanopelagicales bacterium]|nr:homoserine kinase [Candidatus Nanopelagicales bacterium]
MAAELRREPMRILVPASSANIGPAFDSAGLALDIVDDLVAMITDDDGVLIEVAGEGAGSVALDESHLVARSMVLGFAAMDANPHGFILRCNNAIPHGRGLGSSAAAIVGGLALARALVVDGDSLLPDAALLQVAKSMESHPDNISAALYGGLIFAWTNESGSAGHIRLDLHPAIRPVIAVPASGLPTAEARSALPLEVAFEDAAFNVARSALLLHALTTEPAHLLEATSDRLHQNLRRSMYGPSLELVEALRAAGVPAVISGAGPSVLALASDATVGMVAGLAGALWRVSQVSVAGQGVRTVPIER